MTKQELQKVLKPLIKSCIREVLLEEKGILSSIISECVKGLSSANIITEQKVVTNKPQLNPKLQNDLISQKKQEYLDQKRKLLDAIGLKSQDGSMDVFAGTVPLKESVANVVNVGGKTLSVPSPLAGIDPNDPGVNVDAILGNKKWSFK